MPKPPLGPVKVGDRLLVIVPKYNNAYPEPVAADVIKVGRVWIEMEETDQVRSFKKAWRLRLDTQDNGNGRYGERFLTAEQYTWEQRQSAVSDYLREQHVRPGDQSPWRTEERMITLANLMRAHDDLDPL